MSSSTDTRNESSKQQITLEKRPTEPGKVVKSDCTVSEDVIYAVLNDYELEKSGEGLPNGDSDNRPKQPSMLPIGGLPSTEPCPPHQPTYLSTHPGPSTPTPAKDKKSLKRKKRWPSSSDETEDEIIETKFDLKLIELYEKVNCSSESSEDDTRSSNRSKSPYSSL